MLSALWWGGGADVIVSDPSRRAKNSQRRLTPCVVLTEGNKLASCVAVFFFKEMTFGLVQGPTEATLGP